MKSAGLISVAAAALVATIAGVGGTLPVVLAAAQAVGATPDQASSWVSGLGLATAVSALLLSVRYRMPIITAWSTPGAALIASTSGVPSFAAAVGAFVLAALLILLTAAVRPLGRLIEQDPRQHRGRHAGRHPAAPRHGDGRACADLAAAGPAADRAVPGGARLLAGAGLADRSGGRRAARLVAGPREAAAAARPLDPGRHRAGLGRRDADRPRRAALSRHHGVAEPAGLRGAARLGLPAADAADPGASRARHRSARPSSAPTPRTSPRSRPRSAPGPTPIPIRRSAGWPGRSMPCSGG